MRTRYQKSIYDSGKQKTSIFFFLTVMLLFFYSKCGDFFFQSYCLFPVANPLLLLCTIFIVHFLFFFTSVFVSHKFIWYFPLLFMLRIVLSVYYFLFLCHFFFRASLLQFSVFPSYFSPVPFLCCLSLSLCVYMLSTSLTVYVLIISVSNPFPIASPYSSFSSPSCYSLLRLPLLPSTPPPPPGTHPTLFHSYPTPPHPAPPRPVLPQVARAATSSTKLHSSSLAGAARCQYSGRHINVWRWWHLYSSPTLPSAFSGPS